MRRAGLGRAAAKPWPAGSSPPLLHNRATLSHSDAQRTAPAVPMLPSGARVRVEVGRDRIVLQEEVNLPRGEWRYGARHVHPAFSAPVRASAAHATLLVPRRGADACP